MIWQEGWVWIVAGLVLATLEMVIPGYIFLGFAAGALLTGLGLSLQWGLVGLSLPTLLLVFAVLSLASWVLARQVLGVRRGQVKTWDRDINDDP